MVERGPAHGDGHWAMVLRSVFVLSQEFRGEIFSVDINWSLSAYRCYLEPKDLIRSSIKSSCVYSLKPASS